MEDKTESKGAAGTRRQHVEDHGAEKGWGHLCLLTPAPLGVWVLAWGQLLSTALALTTRFTVL